LTISPPLNLGVPIPGSIVSVNASATSMTANQPGIVQVTFEQGRTVTVFGNVTVIFEADKVTIISEE